MYVPSSNSVGKTVFFQYEWNVRSGQQQCGVNRFRSVNFCKLDARTISDYTGARSGSPQSTSNVTGFWKITHMGVPETIRIFEFSMALLTAEPTLKIISKLYL